MGKHPFPPAADFLSSRNLYHTLPVYTQRTDRGQFGVDKRNQPFRTYFEIQHTHMRQAQNIWNEIDSLDFNIHQVQKMDEVKDGIYQLQHIYKENNMNTKFLFGVLSSRMLKCQFDIKEELNSLVHNNALIERDLEECKANL